MTRVSADIPESSVFWTAQKHGQDWTDPDVQKASVWLQSFADRADWPRRLDRAKANFLAAAEGWRSGEDRPLYDPSDTIAWFMLQADTYATDRALIEPGTASRIVGPLKRIGSRLDVLQTIEGVENRVRKLMLPASQTENGLFELLVALAYRLHGWHTVSFVPEQPGVKRTHEFNVTRQSARWAVECKWMTLPDYAIRERTQAEALLAAVHTVARQRDRSISIELDFLDEVSAVTPGEIKDMVETWLRTGSQRWETSRIRARIATVDFSGANALFAHGDRIYFGGSRMIEIMAGKPYDHDSQYSFRARWDEAPDRPRYADAVHQCSIVRWRSVSDTAQRLKAKHFRQVVAKNIGQFPGDRPAVMHVGFDATGGRNVQLRRDMENRAAMATFDPRESRLRWVYGNFIAPEATTQRNESAGTEESAAPYRVGRHRTAAPLPGVLLLSDVRPKRGGHWHFPPFRQR